MLPHKPMLTPNSSPTRLLMRISALMVLATFMVGCASRRADSQAVYQPIEPLRPVAKQHTTPMSVKVTGTVVDPQTCTLPAGSQLQDAIIAAGGFTVNSYQQGVHLVRGDDPSSIYDLRDAEQWGGQDVRLQDGDVVIVPFWLRPAE